MKYNLIAVILLVTFACSKDNESPSDLRGKWKFQTDKFSGEFEIIQDLGSYHIKSGGSFSIGSENFTSTYQHPLVITGRSISEITLSDSQGIRFIGFTNVTFSADYSEMTSTTQSYSECASCANKVVNETVKITHQ